MELVTLDTIVSLSATRANSEYRKIAQRLKAAREAADHQEVALLRARQEVERIERQLAEKERDIIFSLIR